MFVNKNFNDVFTIPSDFQKEWNINHPKFRVVYIRETIKSGGQDVSDMFIEFVYIRIAVQTIHTAVVKGNMDVNISNVRIQLNLAPPGTEDYATSFEDKERHSLSL